MINTISHEGDTDPNYSMIPLHISGMATEPGKPQTANTGGENSQWYCCLGMDFGSSAKC